MGNYHTERYRRDNPWRANDDRRDDDDDKRGSRWMDQEDWQPESSGDSWDEARRRQRLTPGQLSDGGPAPSGYRDERRQERHQGSDLRYGLNVHRGKITNRAVAEAPGLELAVPKQVLAA